jgi:hypothetical protein
MNFLFLSKSVVVDVAAAFSFVVNFFQRHKSSDFGNTLFPEVKLSKD